MDDSSVSAAAAMDGDQQVAFVQGILPTLDWPALVQVSEC